MAVSLTIKGVPHHITDYEVTEDSTPLDADDSTGSVGTISFSTPDLNNVYSIKGERIVLNDTERGRVTGRIISATYNHSTDLYDVECTSRLGFLNRYNVRMKPFVGYFYDAVAYYFQRAGIADDWEMEADLKERWVLLPGWYGELWYNIKRLMVAQGVEIALSNGTIVIRKPRNTVAHANRGDIDRTLSMGGRQLAQNVEVYVYETKELKNAVVYPDYSWLDESDLPSFSAGEVSEYEFQTVASVTSFKKPVHKKTISKRDFSESAYAVVTDDGEAVDPGLFTRLGGIVRVTLNEDSQTFHVWLRGPERYRNKKSELVDRFYLACGDPRKESFNQESAYPSLRILGDGIQQTKELLTFATGLTENETDTDVGITVDSPFVTSKAIATRLGRSLARRYSTSDISLSGTLRNIQPVYPGGIGNQLTNDEIFSRYAGLTYDQIQTQITTDRTYDQSTNDLVRELTSERTFHMMGAAAGARLFDEESHQWFRIRSATISPSGISFQDAEPDTTNNDIYDVLGMYTYDQIQVANQGMLYDQVTLRGAEPIG